MTINRPFQEKIQQSDQGTLHQVKVFKFCFRNLLLVFTSLLVAIVGPLKSTAQQDFPAEINELVADQFFFDERPIGDMVPGFSDDIGTVFVYWDIFNDQEFNYVLSYRVGANSRYESVSQASSTTVPFEGRLYIYCKGSFDTATVIDEPQFPIYLEQVVPDVTTFGYAFEFNAVDVRFKDIDSFLGGYGEHCYQDSLGFECDTSRCDASLNNMFAHPLPNYALPGCAGSGADFHLPGFRYVETGNGDLTFEFVDSFDFSEPNFRLMYRQYSYWDDPEHGYLSTQLFEIPLYQTGDTNMDGEINLLDVATFVDCIANGTYQFQCDIDQNQVVDLLDVEPFGDLLLGN